MCSQTDRFVEMLPVREREARKRAAKKSKEVNGSLLFMMAFIFALTLVAVSLSGSWLDMMGGVKSHLERRPRLKNALGKIGNATKAGVRKFMDIHNSEEAKDFRENHVFVDGEWVRVPGSRSKKTEEQKTEKTLLAAVDVDQLSSGGGAEGESSDGNVAGAAGEAGGAAKQGTPADPPVPGEGKGKAEGDGEGEGLALCPANALTNGNECSSFMAPFALRAKAKQVGFYGASALKADIARAVEEGCSVLWSIDRSDPRSLLFATRGQMSNVFIQYFYMRVVADSHGLRLHENKHTGTLKKINMKYNKSEARSTRSLRHFRYVTLFETGPKEEVLPNAKCGQFYQNYEYFRSERCFAQCLFAPGPDSISPALASMGCNDVAIHIRAPWFRDGVERNYTVPPNSYFDVILGGLKDKQRLGQVWLLSDPRLCKAETAKHLRETWGAKCHMGTVAQDHFLARSAPVFIGSFGTFTWTAAYLSSAREIHLPIDTSLPSGSSWAHWDGLFIDDDERIYYHDMHGEGRPGTTFLKGIEVLGGTSRFAKGIKVKRLEAEGCLPRNVSVVPRPPTPPPKSAVVS